jgi:hypothetical protein
MHQIYGALHWTTGPTANMAWTQVITAHKQGINIQRNTMPDMITD